MLAHHQSLRVALMILLALLALLAIRLHSAAMVVL